MMQHVQHAVGSSDDFLGWLSYMAATSSYVKLNPSVPATTHYRMDGGKLAIDPILMDEFLKQYADALDRGESLSIVERRTDIYKMHFDLDVLDHNPWTEVDINWTLQEIRVAMAECFPSDKQLFRAVVLVAPPKDVNGMWKTGVHVVYPDLQVDSTMGLTLRKVAVMRLNKIQRRLEPLNAWDDVLDRSVHVANGLRMVGSVKMSKCSQCASKRKRMKNVGFDKFVLCDDCSGRTMCNDGRAYIAFLLLDSFGNKDVEGTEEMRQNRYHCVKLSSIRCFSPVGLSRNPDFVLPPGISWEDPGAVKSTSGKGGALVISRKEFRNKDKKQHVAGNNQLIPILEQFLSSSPLMAQMSWSCAGNPYQDVSIVKVLYTKVNFLVNIEGPGSTYCNNKNGFHNSSKVYFEIRSKHLVQRCFCTKSAASEGVSCKEYKSRPVKLPEDLRLLLFPSSSKTLDVTVDQLRQNVSYNMEGCAVVRRTPNKQKEESVYLQRCVQQYAKRVDFLNHLAVTSALESVPLTKEDMYPSSVSSQLCKYKSEDVEEFSAAKLFSMTEEVVLDLIPAATTTTTTTTETNKPMKSNKTPRKRKRVSEQQ
jgi:hypothetical protein